VPFPVAVSIVHVSEEVGGERGSAVDRPPRDYAKSMKHYWDEVMLIPDLADSAAA
jgi:hypothetical protein